MTRLLILLFTLNTIFPATGYAAVCTCHSPALLATSTPAHITQQNKHSQVEPETASHASMPCCHHPSKACHDSTTDSASDSMHKKHCTSGCCANCLGTSVTIVASTLTSILPYIASVAPVSGYSTFNSRTISPELHPPLV